MLNTVILATVFVFVFYFYCKFSTLNKQLLTIYQSNIEFHCFIVFYMYLAVVVCIIVLKVSVFNNFIFYFTSALTYAFTLKGSDRKPLLLLWRWRREAVKTFVFISLLETDLMLW